MNRFHRNRINPSPKISSTKSLFPKTDAALLEMRKASRQLLCANLRIEMALEELEALGPHATVEQIREIAEKYRHES